LILIRHFTSSNDFELHDDDTTRSVETCLTRQILGHFFVRDCVSTATIETVTFIKFVRDELLGLDLSYEKYIEIVTEIRNMGRAKNYKKLKPGFVNYQWNSNTTMKINNELLNANSIYLQFCKKSQNWCKSMRLRHKIKSASFLDKKLWQICHVDGMTSKIHMYYGGAHVNSTMRGCKHAAPTIRTKSTIHRFVSAVVEVNEFRTSQVCFDCNERTHSVRDNNGKTIRGLLYCGSDTCKSCRYKDRDENGAKNIYKVSNDAVPDIFSRRVSWKKNKRLVHYLNIRRKTAKRDQVCDDNKSNKKTRHESIAQDVLDGVMETSV